MVHDNGQRGVVRGPDSKGRCWWCVGHDDYMAYHDSEWGRPVSDDRLLFEKICLEGFQAGLSWLTILRKREAFREVFKGFDPRKIRKFIKKDVTRLLKDERIIRHRGKIESVINNAHRIEELQEEFGSLAAFVWQFEPEEKELPQELNWKILSEMAKTSQSEAMSRALKKRGWSFVGPTTLYAFMQSVGIVNDHVNGCILKKEAEKLRTDFTRPMIQRKKK